MKVSTRNSPANLVQSDLGPAIHWAERFQMEDSDHINDSCASTFCVINLILLMEHFCNCVDALRPDQHFFSHIGTFLSS